MRIGIDLDNTIINYDRAFYAAAMLQHLVPPATPATKRAVKEYLHHHHPEGDVAWQRLQGYVYGRGISAATLYDGVIDCLKLFRQRGWDVVIVSHKTVHGHFDPTACNLRDAARAWLADQGFFSADAWKMNIDSVHFETTRAEKVTRIAALECNYFIDDLVEVFEEPHFPKNTTPVLFAPEHPHPSPFTPFNSWQAIHTMLAQQS
jgi:hypothetical protein